MDADEFRSTADFPIVQPVTPSYELFTAMYCSTSSLKRTHFLEEVDVGDDLPEEREGNEDSIDSNPADDERFNNTSHIPRCLRIGLTLTSAYDNDLVNFGRQSKSS